MWKQKKGRWANQKEGRDQKESSAGWKWLGNWFKEENIFGGDKDDFLGRVKKENIEPRGEDGWVGQKWLQVKLEISNSYCRRIVEPWLMLCPGLTQRRMFTLSSKKRKKLAGLPGYSTGFSEMGKMSELFWEIFDRLQHNPCFRSGLGLPRRESCQNAHDPTDSRTRWFSDWSQQEADFLDGGVHGCSWNDESEQASDICFPCQLDNWIFRVFCMNQVWRTVPQSARRVAESSLQLHGMW